MKNYKLNENEINNIISHYGNGFYNHAIKYINIYAERCQSKTYG